MFLRRPYKTCPWPRYIRHPRNFPIAPSYTYTEMVYEKIYPDPPNGGLDLYRMVNDYIEFYNTKRRHTEIGKVPPDQVLPLRK